MLGGLLVKNAYDNAFSQVTDTLEDQSLVRLAQLETYLSELRNDVSIIASLPEDTRVLSPELTEDQRQAARLDLAETFKSIMSVRPQYFQMRFIEHSDTGMEIVRVNRTENGSLVVVPPDALQPKRSEPYFETASLLARNEAAFSEITLNRENGVIDPTMRPALRVMHPVFSETSERIGFVVINVDYRLLLERILAESPPDRDGFIIDPDGNYLAFSADGSISPLVFHTLRTDPLPETVARALNQTPVTQGLIETKDSISYLASRSAFQPDEIEIGLILSEDRQNALRQVMPAVYQSLTLGILFILIALLASWWLSMKLTEPLTDMTRKLRLGQWKQLPAGLPTKRQDETGDLARAFRDLFERVLDSESRSRAVLENIAESVITLTTDKQISTANPSAEALLGYDETPLVGQTIDDIFPDFDWGIGQLRLNLAPADGSPTAIFTAKELEGRRRDGSRFAAEVSLSEIDRAGQKNYVCVIRDVSERKRAQMQLLEERNFLNLVLDTNPTYIFIKDRNSNIVRSNKAFRTLFKDAPKSQITKRVVTDNYSDKDVQYFDDTDKRGFEEGYSSTQNVIELPDGKRRIMATEKVRFQFADGSPALLCVSKDITEREELLIELSRSNRELDDFAYIASHDLQAPLRVIENAASWLEEDLDGKLDDESQENLALIKSRVRRMGALLNDLLAYSRAGRSASDENNTVVSGTDLIEDALLLLHVPERFSIEVSPDMSEVQVYTLPLIHIFANLINNAIKHHDKETGTISVDVELSDGFYLFSVSDDGPGIDSNYHEKIFQLFQTLRPRDEVEGSGMGLALVKKHLEMRKCKIEVESEPGKGARFQFSWPIALDEQTKTNFR